jgi:outer membrane protein TolC
MTFSRRKINPQKLANSLLRMALFCLAASTAGCQFVSYQAKPIQAEQNTQQFQQRNPTSQDFYAYLQTLDIGVQQFPISQWDRDLLSYCALFYHPDLDVARAQWKAAQATQITAGQRPELKAGGFVGRDGESPWTYGLGIDIYIETAGRREIRLDRAKNLTEAARINIAQTAWNVRSRAMRSLLQYQYNVQLTELLKQEFALRQDMVDILQKRLDAGIASNVELNNARIFAQKTEQAYVTELGRQPALQAALASDLGLPLNQLNGMNIASMTLNADAAGSSNDAIADIKSLQSYALLNRLDIRAALAKYEAAEASLRLEIAKQYPDFVLTPSYVFEQGDRIWTLGLNSLLTLLNRNRGLIAEATALREVEAAQFYALQTRVIRQIEMQQSTVFSVQENVKRAEQVLQVQSQRFKQTQRQFETGIADRLELTGGQLELVIAQQNRLNLSYQLQAALIELEDGLQRPIQGLFKLPDTVQNSATLNNKGQAL